MNLCGLCERNEIDGYLCPSCTLATARRLDAAPRWYEALAGFLHPAATGPSDGPRGLSRTEAPLPVAEPAMTLRGPGGLVGVLEDWREAMQDDRGWGKPVIAGDTARRVRVAARALSINLEWIAASWPMAGAMAEEIRGLERDVRSVIVPTDPADRPIRIGHCPVVPDGQDAPCGAVLTRSPGASSITCQWCQSSWSLHELLTLARAQQDAANTPRTLAS